MYSVNLNVRVAKKESVRNVYDFVARETSQLITIGHDVSLSAGEVEEYTNDDPPEGMVDPGLWYKLDRVMEIAGVDKQLRDLTHIEMANARLFVKERKDI